LNMIFETEIRILTVWRLIRDMPPVKADFLPLPDIYQATSLQDVVTEAVYVRR